MLKAKAHRCVFTDGEALLQQDMTNQGLLILYKGQARVERMVEGEPVLLAVLGPGEICGEMAFLENSGCSASVVADGSVEADAISAADLQQLFDKAPGLGQRFYRSVALTLSRRLRHTSAQMAQNMVRSLTKNFSELLFSSQTW